MTNVVFFHDSSDNTLPNCLWDNIGLLNHVNKEVAVNIITNVKDSIDGCVVHPIINDSFSEFEKHYVHTSPNQKEFELMCFKRWFALKDFFAANQGIGRVLYIENDCLLLVPIEQVINDSNNADATGLVAKDRFGVGCGHNASICYVNEAGINGICELASSLFIVHDGKGRLKFSSEYNGEPVISDMSIFKMAFDADVQKGFTIHNIRDSAMAEHCDYDYNVGTTHYDGESRYVKDMTYPNDDKKHLWSFDGKIFGQLDYGRMIQMRSIHACGQYRHIIKRIADAIKYMKV